MVTFELTRLVQAPKENVWKVISDVTAYAEYAPNLDKAEVVSGEGASMVRRCYDNDGNAWNEDCVLWEEDKQYSMVVDPDEHPLSIKHLQGTWGLEEQDDGVLMKIRFDYDPLTDQPMDDETIQAMLVQTAQPLIEAIFDRWESELSELQ